MKPQAAILTAVCGAMVACMIAGGWVFSLFGLPFVIGELTGEVIWLLIEIVVLVWVWRRA